MQFSQPNKQQQDLGQALATQDRNELPNVLVGVILGIALSWFAAQWRPTW